MARTPVGLVVRILVTGGGIVTAGALFATGALSQNSLVPSSAQDDFGAQTYSAVCASCHGDDLAGGRGPSLFSVGLLDRLGDAGIARTIENGIPGTEMPAFKDVYSPAQIAEIIAYVHSRADEISSHPPAPGGGSLFTDAINPDGTFVHSDKQDFHIQTIAAGLQVPWALAFLPDGRLLVTERPGRLRIIDADGKLLPDPVKGTPTVHVQQDGGMLDVAVHPDYQQNGWIYLSYTELAPGAVEPPPVDPETPRDQRPPNPPSMTVLIRGKLNDSNEWVDTEEIFRAPPALYTSNGSHYGSRFLFDGYGHLFFSLGERGDMSNARRLDTPLGKIHRINDDGSIPEDNPFVTTPGAVKSIWSYGHRNPEGLALDPVSGLFWETEHGPAGGDEINLVEQGKDYGWGVISMGQQPGITRTSTPGMEQPVAWFTPTIAPSGIGFYTGDKYPGWKNNLFVSALRGQELRRLVVQGREIISQEVVYHSLGRVRDVAQGPDGLLYVAMQDATGPGTGISLPATTRGEIVRLEPVQ